MIFPNLRCLDFHDPNLQEDGAGTGGYAKESSKEFQEVHNKQKEKLDVRNQWSLRCYTPVRILENDSNCNTNLYFELGKSWVVFFCFLEIQCGIMVTLGSTRFNKSWVTCFQSKNCWYWLNSIHLHQHLFPLLPRYGSSWFHASEANDGLRKLRVFQSFSAFPSTRHRKQHSTSMPKSCFAAGIVWLDLGFPAMQSSL